MKITKIDVLKVKTSRATWRLVFCRIYTDEGIYGDGEAALAYGNAAPAAYGMVKEFSELIIGMDPLKNEVIWEKLYKDTFWGQNGGPIIFSAISAIDMALWDIKGKYMNVPLHVLLGGKCRDKLRTYASQLQLGWELGLPKHNYCGSTEDYARAAKNAVSEGYDSIKVDLMTFDRNAGRMRRDDRERVIQLKYLRMAEERMAAIREAVGPDVDIIIENHSRLDAPGAIQLAKVLEPYGVFYFEEPNTPNPYTAAYISQKTGVPLASGERIYSRWQYIPYFENKSLSVIQPDIGNCGGITEAKKICDMAHAYDVSVQPHVCASPLSTYTALHLEAVLPNFIIHEHHTNNRMEFNQGLTKYNMQPKNGFMEVPDEPGIGNEISAEAYEMAEEFIQIQ